MHNRRCQELASSLKIEGLTCPTCNYHSKDIRFVDRSPEAKSYFICGACGRSFRPEELPPVHT
jgi:transcription elongation factor Elf1